MAEDQVNDDLDDEIKTTFHKTTDRDSTGFGDEIPDPWYVFRDEGECVAICDTETLANAIVSKLNGEDRPFWVVLYRHRHGIDVGLMWQKDEPTEEEMIATLEGCWEGPGTEADRDDESVEAYGPYYTPPNQEGKLQVNVRIYHGCCEDVEVHDSHGNPVDFELEIDDKDVQEEDDDVD